MASNDLSSGFSGPGGRRKRREVSMSKDDGFPISTSNSSIKKPRRPSTKSKSTSKEYRSFLSVDGNELGAQDLRCFVPKMMKNVYRQNEDANTDGKKFKGLWDQRPEDWDPEVLFADPNNCQNKECAKNCAPCNKPEKKAVAKMFNFLRDKICKAGYQATPDFGVSDLHTNSSRENTASGITSGQYSSASGFGSSVARGRGQSGLSSDYSYTTDPPSGCGPDVYSSGLQSGTSGLSHDNGFGVETVRQEKPVNADMNDVAAYQPDSQEPDLLMRALQEAMNDGSNNGPLLDLLNKDFNTAEDLTNYYYNNNSMMPASGDQEVLYQPQTRMQLGQEEYTVNQEAPKTPQPQQASDGFTGATVASSWPTQMAAEPYVDASASQNSAVATTSRKVTRRKNLMDEVVSEWNNFQREQLVNRDVEIGLFGQQILAILQQLHSNSNSLVNGKDFWRLAHEFLGLMQGIMDQMEDDAISLDMVSNQINSFHSQCAEADMGIKQEPQDSEVLISSPTQATDSKEMHEVVDLVHSMETLTPGSRQKTQVAEASAAAGGPRVLVQPNYDALSPRGMLSQSLTSLKIGAREDLHAGHIKADPDEDKGAAHAPFGVTFRAKDTENQLLNTMVQSRSQTFSSPGSQQKPAHSQPQAPTHPTSQAHNLMFDLEAPDCVLEPKNVQNLLRSFEHRPQPVHAAYPTAGLPSQTQPTAQPAATVVAAASPPMYTLVVRDKDSKPIKTVKVNQQQMEKIRAAKAIGKLQIQLQRMSPADKKTLLQTPTQQLDTTQQQLKQLLIRKLQTKNQPGDQLAQHVQPHTQHVQPGTQHTQHGVQYTQPGTDNLQSRAQYQQPGPQNSQPGFQHAQPAASYTQLYTRHAESTQQNHNQTSMYNNHTHALQQQQPNSQPSRQQSENRPSVVLQLSDTASNGSSHHPLPPAVPQEQQPVVPTVVESFMDVDDS